MADRRMLTTKVTDNDNFVNLSSSAQALYLHLTMGADDDGFCNQISTSMFKAHASVQDLEALLEKKYLLQFENGVIVIKHWRMANALRSDRYTPTAYQEEYARLKLKENKSYSLVDERLPDGCQVVASWLPQKRIEENRIEKVNSTISNEMVCATSVARVIEAWNTLGLSQVTRIVPNSQRDQWLKKRIRDYGEDEIIRAIENVRNSKFLNGENRKGWVITFDWFIRPNNFPKVLDGNYDDGSTAPSKKKQYTTAAEYNPPKEINIDLLEQIRGAMQ